jgi:alpha-L-fucosidase
MLLGMVIALLRGVAAKPVTGSVNNVRNRSSRSLLHVKWLRKKEKLKFSFDNIDAAAPDLAITDVALTLKWREGSDLEQIVELVVSNKDTENYLTWEDTLSITVESQSLDTVAPGSLTRLAPGQSAIVQVGVTNKEGVTPGTSCDATVVAKWGDAYTEGKKSSQDFSGFCGIGDYEASEASLSAHLSPDWFQEIKFGIFIHWGLYAVPAYGNGPGPNQDYAEW